MGAGNHPNPWGRLTCMKALATAVFLAFTRCMAKADCLDVDRALEAIRLTENSPIDFVSKTGARGVYQLKPATWEQYSKQPHEWANSHTPAAIAETRRVALAHAKWIVAKAIPALRIPCTPYSFALVFGPGYGNVEKLNLSDENVRMARRCANIYETLPGTDK